MTLGKSKLNSSWQYLTISILLVLNSFIRNLFITKSIEDICDLYNGQASRPQRSMGIQFCTFVVHSYNYINSIDPPLWDFSNSVLSRSLTGFVAQKSLVTWPAVNQQNSMNTARRKLEM